MVGVADAAAGGVLETAEREAARWFAEWGYPVVDMGDIGPRGALWPELGFIKTRHPTDGPSVAQTWDNLPRVLELPPGPV